MVGWAQGEGGGGRDSRAMRRWGSSGGDGAVVEAVRSMVVAGWEQWRGQGDGQQQGSRAVAEVGGAAPALQNSLSVSFGPLGK